MQSSPIEQGTLAIAEDGSCALEPPISEDGNLVREHHVMPKNNGMAVADTLEVMPSISEVVIAGNISSFQNLTCPHGAIENADAQSFELGLTISEDGHQAGEQHMLSTNFGDVKEWIDDVVVENVLAGSSQDGQDVGIPAQEDLISLSMVGKDVGGSDLEKECGEHLGKNKYYLW